MVSRTARLWAGAFGLLSATAVLLSACSPGPFSILFVGDTSHGENYQARIAERGGRNVLEEGGYDRPLANFRGALRSADLVVANLETPLTDLETSPLAGRKDYVHWSHPERAPESLRRHNIGLVSLANNHAMDYGIPGLRQTIESLERFEISWIGAGLDSERAARPFLTRVPAAGGTLTVAIFGAYEYRQQYEDEYGFYAKGHRGGVNLLSAEDLGAEIARLGEESFTIVFPHWGPNYRPKTKRQTRLAHALIDAGADLVIGHGAHMLQEVERYRGRWIVYSLGNFMFNSPGRYEGRNVDPYSLIARLLFSGPGGRLRIELRLYPIVTDNSLTDYQSRFAEAHELEQARRLMIDEKAEIAADVSTGADRLGRYLAVEIPWPRKNPERDP